MNKFFKVIGTICNVSGDFVYHKIAKELNPKLTKFMNDSWKMAQNSANRAYSQSATFKLQCVILKTFVFFYFFKF